MNKCGLALKLDRRHAVARRQKLSGWLLRGLKTSGITLLSPYQTPLTFSSFIQIVVGWRRPVFKCEEPCNEERGAAMYYKPGTCAE